jgi:hypothetical protein
VQHDHQQDGNPTAAVQPPYTCVGESTDGGLPLSLIDRTCALPWIRLGEIRCRGGSGWSLTAGSASGMRLPRLIRLVESFHLEGPVGGEVECEVGHVEITLFQPRT